MIFHKMYKDVCYIFVVSRPRFGKQELTYNIVLTIYNIGKFSMSGPDFHNEKVGLKNLENQLRVFL